MIKKTILANWPYTRADLFYPFKKLAADFHFIFIYKYKNEGNDFDPGMEVIYWNDYNSPYQILSKINPDLILFHDIESFHQVSLNAAAKNAGIKTLVLEHGFRRGYEVDVAYKKTYQIEPSQHSGNIKSLRTLLFYLKSFKIQKNLYELGNFFKFIYKRKKYGLTIGLYKSQYSFRRPTKYINFTAENSSYVIKRDGAKKSDIELIGIPFFDETFKEFSNVSMENQGQYFLLIDAPFVEEPMFNFSLIEKNAFLKKLNSYCLERGKQLYIKLHPKSYSTAYFEHDNIKYHRNENIARLISGAEGCFFIHQSTLLPFSLLYNRAFLFNKFGDYNADIVDKKIINICDFDNFSYTDIQFKKVTSQELRKITETYFLFTDGNSTQRMKEIIFKYCK